MQRGVLSLSVAEVSAGKMAWSPSYVVSDEVTRVLDGGAVTPGVKHSDESKSFTLPRY